MKNKLFYFIETTDSTNLQLKELLSNNDYFEQKIESFFTLFTHYQTAGRGQGKAEWESEFGKNILASIYFEKIPLLASEQFVFNQYFSLAIYTLLSNYVSHVQIKWPNDIYVKNQKIAGILIEHFIEGDKIKATIAGIGLNINQEFFSPTIHNATSLKKITGKGFDILSLLEQLIAILKENYFLLEQTKKDFLHEKYLENLYLFQKKHFFMIDGEKVERKIVGINSYGQLLLQDKNGIIKSFGFKEVVFL